MVVIRVLWENIACIWVRFRGLYLPLWWNDDIYIYIYITLWRMYCGRINNGVKSLISYLNFFLKWLILGRTGLTWTYQQTYARTRRHLWGSNSWPLGSEAWPLNHCAFGEEYYQWWQTLYTSKYFLQSLHLRYIQVYCFSILPTIYIHRSSQK